MSPVSCGMPSKCMIACQAPLLVSRDSSTDDFDSIIDVNKSAEYNTGPSFDCYEFNSS